MILLYVDDMLIVGNCFEKIREIISKLKDIFRMKDLGEPKVFLNMNIKRNRETQTSEINQAEYIAKILARLVKCRKGKFRKIQNIHRSFIWRSYW